MKILYVSLLLILWTSISHAEMSMDAVRTEFQQKTGMSWETATAEEKQNFIRSRQKTIEEKIQAKQPPKDTSIPVLNKKPTSNLRRQVNVEVRKYFLEKMNKDWEDATEEEQDKILAEYKAWKEKEGRLKAVVEQREKQRLQKEEQLKQNEIAAKERKKKFEEMQAIKEAQEREKERRAERKKMDDAMRKLEKMRQEFQRKQR